MWFVKRFSHNLRKPLEQSDLDGEHLAWLLYPAKYINLILYTISILP